MNLKYQIPDITNPAFDWQPIAEIGHKAPTQCLHWLQDQGSLTQQLKLRSHNNFQVEVVEEQWLTISSSKLLELFGPVAPGHRFWSRKVVLKGNGVPWVMAHTLVPNHSFVGALSELQRLEDRPLGEFLFNHPQLVRSGMDIATYRDNDWGRRSLFYLFSKPVMVAEFFLPALVSGGEAS